MTKCVITYEEIIEQGNIVVKVHAIEYDSVDKLKEDFHKAVVDFVCDFFEPECKRRYRGFSIPFCGQVFYMFNFCNLEEMTYIEPQILSLEDWFEYQKDR
jgi:hypothetical protein